MKLVSTKKNLTIDNNQQTINVEHVNRNFQSDIVGLQAEIKPNCSVSSSDSSGSSSSSSYDSSDSSLDSEGDNDQQTSLKPNIKPQKPENKFHFSVKPSRMSVRTTAHLDLHYKIYIFLLQIMTYNSMRQKCNVVKKHLCDSTLNVTLFEKINVF